MSNEQNTLNSSWAELNKVVENAHNQMNSTDDLDLVVDCIEKANPALEAMNKKIENAVAIGARMYGDDKALKSIQSMVKTLLSSASDIDEKYPEEVVTALNTIASAELK